MLDLSRQPARPLVAASILSADFGAMARDCRDVLDRGADLLHIDVMDGHFVPNLTMGQDMIRALRKHLPDTFLDVHLMVERPGEYVDSFADAGANLFNFHLEACRPYRPDGEDVEALVRRIERAGMKPGMTVNPPTPVNGLLHYVDQLALVLVMSVFPGRSGQAFRAEVLPKVRQLRDAAGPGMRVQIDGGISPQTAPQAASAGADVLVTASALFGAEDRSAVIAALHSARR